MQKQLLSTQGLSIENFCNKLLYLFTGELPTERRHMYTTDERGILNDYSTEPATYYAEYLFVGELMRVGISVS